MGVFENCKSLASVTIPESVTFIGKEVFKDCKALSFITIPESVTSIGIYAFNNCPAQKFISIPKEQKHFVCIGNYKSKVVISNKYITFARIILKSYSKLTYHVYTI